MTQLDGNFNINPAAHTPQQIFEITLEVSDNFDSVTGPAAVRNYVEHIRKSLLTPLTPLQDLALREVVGDVSATITPGFIDRGGALAFVHMNRLVVGAQLAVRVVNYNRIQQQQHQMCGPVTLMHDFARREPLQYVRYVIGLAENRRGVMALAGKGSKVVKINSGSNILQKVVRRAPGGTHGVLEADYIALASLRNDASILPYKAPLTNTMLQGATSTSELAAWMTETGYSNVTDHTLNRAWAVAAKVGDLRPKFESHIAGLQAALVRGDIIFLNATGSLTEHQLNQTITGGLDGAFMTYFGGHWMLCREIVVSHNQGVRFALDSWGKSSSAQFQPSQNYWLPWSKVMSWYRGYLSGTP
jgi:hypothetical protein